MTDTPENPQQSTRRDGDVTVHDDAVRIRYGTRTDYDPKSGLYLSAVTEHVEPPRPPGGTPADAGWVIDDSPPSPTEDDR